MKVEQCLGCPGPETHFLFGMILNQKFPRNHDLLWPGFFVTASLDFTQMALSSLKNQVLKTLIFAGIFTTRMGPSAEMCGNAARCAALFFQKRVADKSLLRFMTLAGPITAKIFENEILEVEMPPLAEPGKFISIQNGKNSEEFYFVNTGVPHLVVEVPPDEELARFLRRASELGPAGANVTFVTEVTPGEAEAVTFERGVESFTLSCGTGAVAAAAFLREKNPMLKNFEIEMPGGTLKVAWKSEEQAALTGQAQFEFDITFREERE